MEFIPIKEVAKQLNRTTDEVIEILSEQKVRMVTVVKFSRYRKVSQIENGTASQMDIIGDVIIDVSRLEFDKHGEATLFDTPLEQDGKRYYSFEKRIITRDEVFVTAESLAAYKMEEGYDPPVQEQKSQASAALKSLQTADIDRQIDDVIQTIDAAIEKHLRGDSKNMVVNHMRFLKEAGIADKKRAKKKVKTYIETIYKSKGYPRTYRQQSCNRPQQNHHHRQGCSYYW